MVGIIPSNIADGTNEAVLKLTRWLRDGHIVPKVGFSIFAAREDVLPTRAWRAVDT